MTIWAWGQSAAWFDGSITPNRRQRAGCWSRLIKSDTATCLAAAVSLCFLIQQEGADATPVSKFHIENHQSNEPELLDDLNIGALRPMALHQFEE